MVSKYRNNCKNPLKVTIVLPLFLCVLKFVRLINSWTHFQVMSQWTAGDVLRVSWLMLCQGFMSERVEGWDIWFAYLLQIKAGESLLWRVLRHLEIIMSTWECHYSRCRYTKSPSTRGAWQRWPQATHCWFLSGFRLLGCWLNLSQNKQLGDALGAVFVVTVFNLHKILLLYMFRMKLYNHCDCMEINDQLLLKLEMLFSWDKKVIWAQNLLFLFFCGNDSVRVL